MSSESVMPSKHLILCRPLLSLPTIFPSIRVFSMGSQIVGHDLVPEQQQLPVREIFPKVEFGGKEDIMGYFIPIRLKT